MDVGRGLAAITIAAGCALGLAAPAWADDFSGTYSLKLLGASGTTSWAANSRCSASGQCIAHITASTGWSGDAQLAGGQWTMAVDRADGQSCADGSRHAEIQMWTWNENTLDGQVSGVSNDPACPEGPPDPFTLTRMR